MTPILLVNFGGPRSVEEIPSFLTALLQDRDVVRTRLPTFLHNYLFGRVARKRSTKIAHDYLSIGGKSPIYFDTEAVAKNLREKLSVPVVTFHRYLPATHKDSLAQIEQLSADTIRVLPLFPQFCYATTGSIARFLDLHLSPSTVSKLRWLPSYASHPSYISSFEQTIKTFLQAHHLEEKDTALLFSAHGVPRLFSNEGDPYQSECESSYKLLSARFPAALSYLSYQSKFGRGEWIRPYTDETCEEISWAQNRPNIVVIPLTFTSDHIETLFEIEQLYLPVLREQGVLAYRCPALNLDPHWIDALAHIANSPFPASTASLIRPKKSRPIYPEIKTQLIH